MTFMNPRPVKRYYILTEKSGVEIIEASIVDEFSPSIIQFVNGAASRSIDRFELVWWGLVDAALPGPFGHIGRVPDPRSLANSVTEPFWKTGGSQAPVDRDGMDPQHVARVAFNALIEATHSRVPRGWRKAGLELKVSYDIRTGEYKVAHRIRNPDSDTEVMDFSDHLFATIDVFHRVAVKAGSGWNQCRVLLNLGEHGRCFKAEATYEYGVDFGPR